MAKKQNPKTTVGWLKEKIEEITSSDFLEDEEKVSLLEELKEEVGKNFEVLKKTPTRMKREARLYNILDEAISSFGNDDEVDDFNQKISYGSHLLMDGDYDPFSVQRARETIKGYNQ